MRNFLFYIILLLPPGLACQSANEVTKNPPGYDLDNPVKHFMPDVLLEVSGITFKDGNRDSLYAQQDEIGSIFILKTGEKKYRETHVAKDGDFEDIAEMDEHFFLLRSDGRLYSMPAGDLNYRVTPTVKEWQDFLPKGEYEGMFADKEKRELLVLCKDCPVDKKNESLSIIVLDWKADSTLDFSRVITLKVDDIANKLEEKMKGKRFQPSALARHPLSGEWFILSSVNKLLVITDEEWKVKSAWKLPASRFRQPEGITFDKSGNLFISNEGDEVTSGNVLEFAYNP